MDSPGAWTFPYTRGATGIQPVSEFTDTTITTSASTSVVQQSPVGHNIGAPVTTTSQLLLPSGGHTTSFSAPGPQHFLAPHPSHYERRFTPMFHTHCAANLRPPPTKVTADYVHTQQTGQPGFFEQPIDHSSQSLNWQGSPFGILPHENVPSNGEPFSSHYTANEMHTNPGKSVAGSSSPVPPSTKSSAQSAYGFHDAANSPYGCGQASQTNFVQNTNESTSGGREMKTTNLQSLQQQQQQVSCIVPRPVSPKEYRHSSQLKKAAAVTKVVAVNVKNPSVANSSRSELSSSVSVSSALPSLSSAVVAQNHHSQLKMTHSMETAHHTSNNRTNNNNNNTTNNTNNNNGNDNCTHINLNDNNSAVKQSNCLPIDHHLHHHQHHNQQQQQQQQRQQQQQQQQQQPLHHQQQQQHHTHPHLHHHHQQLNHNLHHQQVTYLLPNSNASTFDRQRNSGGDTAYTTPVVGPSFGVAVVPRHSSPQQINSQTPPHGHIHSPAYPIYEQEHLRQAIGDYKSAMQSSCPPATQAQLSHQIDRGAVADAAAGVVTGADRVQVSYPSVITRALISSQQSPVAGGSVWDLDQKYLQNFHPINKDRVDEPTTTIRNGYQGHDTKAKVLKPDGSASKEPNNLGDAAYGRREPPPAHSTNAAIAMATANVSPNGSYVDFDRWNLGQSHADYYNTAGNAAPTFIASHQLRDIPTQNAPAHQLSHMQHGAGPSYFRSPHLPGYCLQPQVTPIGPLPVRDYQQPVSVATSGPVAVGSTGDQQQTGDKEHPRVLVPNINEELSFLQGGKFIGDMQQYQPPPPLPSQFSASSSGSGGGDQFSTATATTTATVFINNKVTAVESAQRNFTKCFSNSSANSSSTGFISSYLKFLQGGRDNSPPPVSRPGRKGQSTWPKVYFGDQVQQNNIPKERKRKYDVVVLANEIIQNVSKPGEPVAVASASTDQKPVKKTNAKATQERDSDTIVSNDSLQQENTSLVSGGDGGNGGRLNYIDVHMKCPKW